MASSEQELDKKLAEWLGLVDFTDDAGSVYIYERKLHKDPPNFTQSLDACFKWLVPKIHAYCLQSFNEGHKNHHATVALPYASLTDIKTFGATVSRKENPALALCLAIEKLIDKGGQDGK